MTATVKTKKEACICALSATDTDELAVTRQNDGQDSHDKDLDRDRESQVFPRERPYFKQS